MKWKIFLDRILHVEIVTLRTIQRIIAQAKNISTETEKNLLSNGLIIERVPFKEYVIHTCNRIFMNYNYTLVLFGNIEIISLGCGVNSKFIQFTIRGKVILGYNFTFNVYCVPDVLTS